MVIGKRGGIFQSNQRGTGHGTSWSWSRTINGKPYSFTFVIMPNGELRWFVEAYNGYGDDGTDWGRAQGMRFGCAWSPVKTIIVRSEGE